MRGGNSRSHIALTPPCLSTRSPHPPFRGQTACIKELLYKGGADPNVQDHLQHTPFMMAAWFGKIDSAREIFEKVGAFAGREDTRALAGAVGDAGPMVVAFLVLFTSLSDPTDEVE